MLRHETLDAVPKSADPVAEAARRRVLASVRYRTSRDELVFTVALCQASGLCQPPPAMIKASASLGSQLWRR